MNDNNNNNNNNNFLNLKINLNSIINHNLKKYFFSNIDYNNLQIQFLLQNTPCHLVSLFKDYLIFDDNFEFNQKYFKISETFLRLEKIFLYYSISSKIFPNYTVIPEGKFLYQNIMKLFIIYFILNNFVIK